MQKQLKETKKEKEKGNNVKVSYGYKIFMKGGYTGMREREEQKKTEKEKNEKKKRMVGKKRKED